MTEDLTEEEKLMDGKNFRGKGPLFVVYCPSCKKENYGPAVASGQCAWCGWFEDDDND